MSTPVVVGRDQRRGAVFRHDDVDVNLVGTLVAQGVT
jgi:hypothetical protein